MSESTNHKRAERRREKRRQPQPPIYYRQQTPQIRMAITEFLSTQDPEVLAKVSAHGLTYMLNRSGFHLRAREVEVLMYEYFRGVSERIACGENPQTAQMLGIQELISGEQLHKATPEEIEKITGKQASEKQNDCPPQCFTSGREPHTRHYHHQSCPLSDWEDLQIQTQLLPGLAQITYQGEAHKLSCYIIKEDCTAVLWLNQGTHEYHLPMDSRLAFHKESPYVLVLMDSQQPIYEVISDTRIVEVGK